MLRLAFPREVALVEAALTGKVDWFKVEEARPGELVIKLWSAMGFVWEDIQLGMPKIPGIIFRFEEAKAPLLTRVMSRWRAMRRLLRSSKSMRLGARYRIARRCWKDHPGQHYEGSMGSFIRDRLLYEGYRRRVESVRIFPPPELFPPKEDKP